MPQKNNFKIFYAISLAWQLGFIIAIPLVVFVFLGFWVDKFLNTSPLFIILGILTGMTITVYEIYQMLVPLIKNKQ